MRILSILFISSTIVSFTLKPGSNSYFPEPSLYENEKILAEKTVKLSDIGSVFLLFEGNEKYDYVTDKIIYQNISHAKYDELFQSSATFYATTKQMEETLKKLESGEEPLDSDYAKVAIAFGVQSLPAMVNELADTQSSVSSLNPKDDFKGIKMMKKIPKATSGLNDSKKYLEMASKNLPDLIEGYKAINEKKQESK